MTDAEPIDRARLQSVCMGDEALAVELIGMLVDEALPLVEQLDGHVRAGDVPQAHEVAHSLKGIAGNVGAAELREAASRMQSATEAGETPASELLVTQFGDITAALERVRATHQAWAAQVSRAVSIFA